MRHRTSDSSLPRLVEAFFRDHLGRLRAASPHTVRAYRDALRLFFVFLAEVCHGGRVKDLDLDDLTVDRVLAFLGHLEERRANSIATRGARLVAVRSLIAFLLRNDPTRAEQYHRVLSLRTRHPPPRPAVYLEPEEVRTLLRQPDPATPAGARDQALVLFLYNTGARVSEALAVRPADVQLQPPRQVRLRGKGGRERLCSLWPETAEALRRVHPQPHDGEPFFRNARGGALGRDGVAYILRKYARTAATALPTIARVRLTPHVLRHSCAVGLLQEGVDLATIRDHLGHASVATTSRYLATNIETRRAALERFWRSAGLERAKRPRWRPSAALIDFLESL